jgi:hypothetical protein
VLKWNLLGITAIVHMRVQTPVRRIEDLRADDAPKPDGLRPSLRQALGCNAKMNRPTASLSVGGAKTGVRGWQADRGRTLPGPVPLRSAQPRARRRRCRTSIHNVFPCQVLRPEKL